MDMASPGPLLQILVTATLLSATLLSVSGLAAAQPAAPAAPEAATIEELQVQPTATCLQPWNNIQAPPPRVVSTFPANGAVVRPGVLVLRVTFDQPMSCKGFFGAAAQARSPCPTDTQYWVLSFDRRTIRTFCRTELNSHYGVRISDQSGGDGSRATFISLAGKRLAPYVLTFDTSSEPPVATPGESLNQDVGMREPEKDVPLKVQEFRGKR
jgi:hypothetical protein